MRKELDEDLCRKYPKLYRDRNGDMQSTCMVWGFECGEGWYQLLDDLSRELEAEIERVEREEGAEAASHMSAVQVKEKYASLRYYMSSETEEMSRLICEAERRSEKTCEVTGKPGEPRNVNGWFQTLCDDEYYKALASRWLHGAYVAGTQNDKAELEKSVEWAAQKLKNIMLRPKRFANKEKFKYKLQGLYYWIKFSITNPHLRVKWGWQKLVRRVKYQLWRHNRKKKGLWVA